MTANVDVAHELGVFLRARRERLDPEAVDLPRRRRTRRTPGLRREEVAELAGVSVDYVIRLEQGRGLRPSPDVLDALARALRLSDDERAYLFDLTRHWSAARRRSDGDTAALAALVSALSPLPAMVIDHRFDIVAWNPEMAWLMLDFPGLPPEQRNALYLCVLHPAFAGFYRDRERIIREGIADLRAAWAAHPDDAALASLVERLSQDEEFARLWERRDVMVNGHGTKALLHPRVGAFSIAYDVLTPLGDLSRRLIVYRAADAESQEALDTVAREARTGASALHAI
ncbi:helix-turn-helix transcriptional regulator [Actinomadura sp. DC4]|uniref:helix-turn-helix transcriptional regulator n=1 Tax=Actinomadura sp. DC4 TaxID=3055069 RepID=UPI0025B0E808|nr:helix-turn-helix transcriptional regulator [Actinomadura sp. DC4]MDN3355990.1 helix-turn-helix transcriptional regulator [Actinomadura sp. DC4]